MELTFEEITKETLYIALEIINSNPQYNVFENGRETRTEKEIEVDVLNPNTESVFIKADDTYIGVIDYMMINPKDQTPWLGLLIIHGDYHGYGFGTLAYKLFEKEIVKRGADRIRIGVIKENAKAYSFWESLGFNNYNTVIGENQKEIVCYEKILN